MAEGFKLSPRCDAAATCCEQPDCTVFEDTFTRADSATVGNSWTEDAGTSAIDSNNLLFSAADTMVQQAFSCIYFNYDFEIEFNGQTDEEFLVGGAGAQMWVKIGASGFIGYDAGGLKSFCPQAIAANTWHHIRYSCGRIYLNGVQLIGRGRGHAGVIGSELFTSTRINSVGATSNLRFRNYKVRARNDEDYPECGTCFRCPWILRADQDEIKLVVAGATDLIGPPDYPISNINGTYFLERCPGSCHYRVPVNIFIGHGGMSPEEQDAHTIKYMYARLFTVEDTDQFFWWGSIEATDCSAADLAGNAGIVGGQKNFTSTLDPGYPCADSVQCDPGGGGLAVNSGTGTIYRDY